MPSTKPPSLWTATPPIARWAVLSCVFLGPLSLMGLVLVSERFLGIPIPGGSGRAGVLGLLLAVLWVGSWVRARRSSPTGPRLRYCESCFRRVLVGEDCPRHPLSARLDPANPDELQLVEYHQQIQRRRERILAGGLVLGVPLGLVVLGWLTAGSTSAIILRQECQAGQLSSCVALGQAHEYGTLGLEMDAARAVAYYQAACDQHSGAACSALGTLAVFGEGVPRDLIRAAALYKRACEGGFAPACIALGGLYDRGEGVPNDPARAAALYDKVCEGIGIDPPDPDAGAVGCTSLGLLYRAGRGVPRDLDRASAYIRRGQR